MYKRDRSGSDNCPDSPDDAVRADLPSPRDIATDHADITSGRLIGPMTPRVLPLLLLISIILSGCCLPLAPVCIGTGEDDRVRQIWSRARHNGFTDLVRYRGYFYCALREGVDHSPQEPSSRGKIRIIRSTDGRDWSPVALIENGRVDLRDPKLSVTPDRRLMVLMGGVDYEFTEDGRDVASIQPYASYSDERGSTFTHPKPARIDSSLDSPTNWLWNVTWHEGSAYGVLYQVAEGYGLHLVRGERRAGYELETTLDVSGRPSEGVVRFNSGGAMEMILRRGGDQADYLGFSDPPYISWSWREVSRQIAGPALLVLDDGTRVMAARTTFGESKETVVGVLEKDGRFHNLIRLPSGGDNGYPGLAEHDGSIWVSYYSSHALKPSIYLAEVPVDSLTGRSR